MVKLIKSVHLNVYIMKVLCTLIICLAIAGCSPKKIPASKPSAEKPLFYVVNDVTVFVFGVPPLLNGKEQLLAVFNRPYSAPRAIFQSVAFDEHEEGMNVPITRYVTEITIHPVFSPVSINAKKDTIIRYRGYVHQHVGNHINIADGSTVY